MKVGVISYSLYIQTALANTYQRFRPTLTVAMLELHAVKGELTE